MFVIVLDMFIVQWFGEFWCKYYQVFVLFDEKCVKDVVCDYGDDFNFFDVYDCFVMSYEFFVDNLCFIEQVCEVGIDLIIVDEVYYLKCLLGYLGNQFYCGIELFVVFGINLLLFLVVLFEDDVYGFFCLLQFLCLDDFQDWEIFQVDFEIGKELLVCMLVICCDDIGGLVLCVGMLIDFVDDDVWKVQDEFIEMIWVMLVKGICVMCWVFVDFKFVMLLFDVLVKQWQQCFVEEYLFFVEVVVVKDL